MVAKTGTFVLIMKLASEVGPLSSCFCMKFLTSNDFGGRLPAKPAILKVGYLRKNIGYTKVRRIVGKVQAARR